MRQEKGLPDLLHAAQRCLPRARRFNSCLPATARSETNSSASLPSLAFRRE